jgi:phosphoribosylaminoimidazolecarboxamide formyltransferase/IMP cyclohydrolase
VFGGILARRSFDNDEKQLAQYEIPEIDLVIVDLYPFEETVESGAGAEDVIEKDRYWRYLTYPRSGKKL